MNWISVKDRLPEEDCDVLIKSENGIIKESWFNKDSSAFEEWGSFEKYGFHSFLGSEEFITHWMPLTEPPKDIK